MSSYRTWQTTQGLALAASLLAGGNIAGTPFTRIEVGSGRYDPDEPLDGLTGLKNYQQTYPINGIRVLNDTHVLLEVVITNEPPLGPTSSYDIGEIGVYANNTAGEEILYAIVLPNEGTRLDQMTPYDGGETNELRLELKVVVARAEVAYLQPGSGAYALTDDLEALKRQFERLGPGALQTVIRIPQSAWHEDPQIGLYADVPVERATANAVPLVTVARGSQATALSCDLQPLPEAMDGSIRFTAERPPFADISALLVLLNSYGATCPVDITIPAGAWTVSSPGSCSATVACSDANETTIPFMVPCNAQSRDVALACGLDTLIDAVDGALTFTADRLPTSDMDMFVVLLHPGVQGAWDTGLPAAIMPATAQRLGAIKLGSGLKGSSDGTVSVDVDGVIAGLTASDSEVSNMLNGVFH